ncbi:hypothetical protein BGZ60DRAFT_400595 [Tricladium varicosporioides]|nr:hypothetical protein BGZ60DRAFT_400595 [Hymenoscyphus varicosporioides]
MILSEFISKFYPFILSLQLWITSYLTYSISDLFPIPRVIPGHYVPGGSDFRYCDVSDDSDLLAIDELNVWPTPVVLGESLKVHIFGTFQKSITPNATWGYSIDINNGERSTSGLIDLCDVMNMIEQPNKKPHTCPPEKGGAIVTIGAYMFSWYGPGQYKARFDAKTEEGERIYCVEADVWLAEKNDTQSGKLELE